MKRGRDESNYYLFTTAVAATATAATDSSVSAYAAAM